MKTKTFRVQPHVRKSALKRYEKQTDSRTAINFLNQLIKAARAEMHTQKTVHVTGYAKLSDPEKVQFTAGDVKISLNFKNRNIAV